MLLQSLRRRIVDEADFDAERWYGILQNRHHRLVYGADAIRMMMKVRHEPVRKLSLRRLRFLATAWGNHSIPRLSSGESRALGVPSTTTGGRPKLGGIMIANYAAIDMGPG